MTPEEIITLVKKSIVPENKLITREGEVIPLPEDVQMETNCYAYILGAMHPRQGSEWYQPGFTTGTKYEKGNKEDFIKNLEQDFQNLGFSYRELPHPDSYFLKRGEYMVNVYFNNSKAKEDGFHFIRNSRYSGVWFHKEGWPNSPRIVNSGEENAINKSKIFPTSIQFPENNDVAVLIATYALKYNG